MYHFIKKTKKYVLIKRSSLKIISNHKLDHFKIFFCQNWSRSDLKTLQNPMSTLSQLFIMGHIKSLDHSSHKILVKSYLQNEPAFRCWSKMQIVKCQKRWLTLWGFSHNFHSTNICLRHGTRILHTVGLLLIFIVN